MKRSPFVVSKRADGFTLIELLVVLVIIAVLAAILFPVFASTREKGRATACFSNYHQIGLAINAYAGDFDSLVPPDGGNFQGLIDDCAPYTHTARIFQCPDDFDMKEEGRPGSYRIPTLYQGLPITCTWKDPYSSVLARPSSTVMVYEAEHDANTPIETTYRHSDGTQVLYFDSHAKWIRRPPTATKDDD